MSNWQLPGSDLRDDSVQAQKLDRTDTYDFATAGGTVRVQAPAAGTDVANKTYVDALIAQNPPVEVVETAADITIDGSGALPTIDGYAVQNNDRVLLISQTDPVENGIWIAHAIGTAWERPGDFAAGDHAGGRSVMTKAGIYWRDLEMTCTTNPPNDVIGTDALGFAQEGNRIPGGFLTIGTDDLQRGSLYCTGHATGQAEGGKVVLNTSDDYDATIQSFTIRVYEDDLEFLVSAAVKLTYKGAEDRWDCAADFLMAAAKDLDCYTNGGYLKPRRVRQDAQPTPDPNEAMFWCDSNDSDRIRLVYNDATKGVVSVELT